MGHIAQPARNQEIRNLHAEGNLNQLEIGQQFNISRQRVKQIVQGKNRTRNQAIRALLEKGVQPEILAETYQLTQAHVEAIGRGKTLGRPPNRQGAQATYAFIVQYMLENHGLPPSIREIAEGVGIPSTSTVSHYLHQLERENKIAYKGAGGSRNFYIPGSVWTPPK